MLRFLQLANNLHDLNLLHDLLAHLSKMANKMHEGIKHTANKVNDMANKVEDIHKILFKLKSTMHGLDTLAQQEIPMKPEIFHG